MALIECQTCVLWKSTKGKAGRCHRLAPAPVSIVVQLPDDGPQRYVNAKWPSTFAEDGCSQGEVDHMHQKRQNVASISAIP